MNDVTNDRNCKRDRDEQALRFVVLLHEMPPSQTRATHWDLMLEQFKSTDLTDVADESEGLATWALDGEPSDASGTDGGIRCLRLAPHRIEYLDYEGPISRNRGSVRQWTTGFYRCQHWGEHEIILEFQRSKIDGLFRLLREVPGSEDKAESRQPLASAAEKSENDVWRFQKID